MPYKDPEKRRACVREAQLRYYSRNKAKYRTHRNNLHARNVQWLKDLKSRLCCAVCGENDPEVLDFHHEHSKDIAVAKAVTNRWSIARIEREIAKCTVLCANDHRRLHARQRATRAEIETSPVTPSDHDASAPTHHA
jgi:hypothetical protein